jgi:hypothetical protein
MRSAFSLHRRNANINTVAESPMLGAVLLLVLLSYLSPTTRGTQKIEMIDLSDAELYSFYDPVDSCILKTHNFTQCRLQQEKSILRSCPYCDHYCLATWQCHFTPSALYQKPSDLTRERVFGQKNLVNFLLHLNDTNKKLVLFGDSITRQSLQALFCLLLQQNHRIRITPPLHSLDKTTQNYHFRITIPLSSQSSSAQSSPYSSSSSSLMNQNISSLQNTSRPRHITVSFINFPHEITSPSQLQEILFNPISQLSATCDGLILITNWGLHSTKQNYFKLLLTLFEWAESAAFLSHPSQQNVFFYRETSSQHFPNSPYGLYGERNGQQTTCQDIDSRRNNREEGDPATGRSWMSVVEDELLKQFQSQSLLEGREKRIERLSFRDISSRYADLHHSSKGNMKRFQFPVGYSDCTHYCGVPPLLWYALWTQLATYKGFDY